ncbi:MAG: reverse transcriptase domain-containing protein [Candidatus Andersenbacteria bacterium]
MRRQLAHTFNDVISLENLLCAWAEFLNGKRNKPDVQLFGRHLMDNLNALHRELKAKQYRHGGYYAFSISDPKPRNIHKASVRDRVLHHAVYRSLYPFFDRIFIPDSYSCREEKGTHKALEKFRRYGWKASKNNTRTCWVLKCDIRKFFASINQDILAGILSTYIPDTDVIWLIEQIVRSFHSTQEGVGLPLGNLTSQLLVNVYMNEFDQYAKHSLKAKHYIRYADDFVFLSDDKDWLVQQLPYIERFLREVLSLSLHPDKVYIRSLASGVDFLGWVHFPDHQALRSTSARRMHKRLRDNPKPETFQSYLGLLSHGNTEKLQAEVANDYWLWGSKEEGYSEWEGGVPFDWDG